ncbi:MAG TPA: energy-coupling factor transporter transmembrane component T [Methylomirabilota bacterium]|nr:energy-coupling factor transporter transmembrane component T [Methylomirabilota bacterium]
MIKIKYFPGNTFLHRLDPRSKFLLLILFIFCEVAFLDIRFLIFPFVASILLYLSAKIPFNEAKSTWKFLLTIIVVISAINAFFTFLGVPVTNPHIIASWWVFKITVEGVVFAVAAIMRFLSLATISLCVIMTTDPGLYAPALAKLKMPYKGAFVVDLSLRYLPVYADELDTTMNAQMARGYKVKIRGGLFSRILNTVPLIVPVAMNAMLSIYDVADAMELRAFGLQKSRTWYRTVSLKRLDYATILSLTCLLAFTIFLRTRVTTYWIPS